MNANYSWRRRRYSHSQCYSFIQNTNNWVGTMLVSQTFPGEFDYVICWHSLDWCLTLILVSRDSDEIIVSRSQLIFSENKSRTLILNWLLMVYFLWAVFRLFRLQIQNVLVLVPLVRVVSFFLTRYVWSNNGPQRFHVGTYVYNYIRLSRTISIPNRDSNLVHQHTRQVCYPLGHVLEMFRLVICDYSITGMRAF